MSNYFAEKKIPLIHSFDHSKILYTNFLQTNLKLVVKRFWVVVFVLYRPNTSKQRNYLLLHRRRIRVVILVSRSKEIQLKVYVVVIMEDAAGEEAMFVTEATSLLTTLRLPVRTTKRLEKCVPERNQVLKEEDEEEEATFLLLLKRNRPFRLSLCSYLVS